MRARALATAVLLVFAASGPARADPTRKAVWPLYVGVSLLAVGSGTSIYFGATAMKDQSDARGAHYYVTDPRLKELQSSFRAHRAGWIAGCGIAAAGAGLLSYWLVRRNVTMTIQPGSATTVAIGWTFSSG